MLDYRQALADLLATALDTEAAELYPLLEIPPQSDLGDYAFPCFKLAKKLRKAPAQIALDLAERLKDRPEYLARVEVAGPYLNFFLDPRVFTADVLRSVLDSEQAFSASRLGQEDTVIVEYSSPNIAKPFHVGHAFTTILGESLKRIYHHLGYKSLGFNHLGDYGTQFGKLIVAFDLWGDAEAVRQNAIQELTRIYVKFHNEAKDHPELEDRARERFRALEQGGEQETALWTEFRTDSLKEFNRVYERLNIQFDNLNGESFYTDKIPAVVKLLEEKQLLEDSEGAKVVRLDDEKMPPCIILKSDGTTIYASRDLAAILYRYENWHFKKNIYVVGVPQSLHFKQVFTVLEKAGVPAAEGCVHVAFGTVKFPGMKMSTRSGDVILLEDFLNEAVAKTREIIVKNAELRGSDLSEQEIAEIAERVGVAAVQFNFLKNGRERDIVFTWEDMLDFEGETAPYLLYTNARAKSILRKAGLENSLFPQAELKRLGDEQEFALARNIAGLIGAVQSAAEAYEPSILARQLLLIARSFNKFYANSNILNEADLELREARLALCAALSRALEEGLELLGIRAVERM